MIVSRLLSGGNIHAGFAQVKRLADHGIWRDQASCVAKTGYPFGGHVLWGWQSNPRKGTDPVTKSIKLTLTEDEAEIVLDALDADMEGYVESAKEARGNNNRADVKTFSEAAERIDALSKRIRAMLD